jgi:hypothetical protein
LEGFFSNSNDSVEDECDVSTFTEKEKEEITINTKVKKKN